METVDCNCARCGAKLGRFTNLWTQIGKSYFSPAVTSQEDPWVMSQGVTRIGEKGTLVDGWYGHLMHRETP